jgi:hypothetical protein
MKAAITRQQSAISSQQLAISNQSKLSSQNVGVNAQAMDPENPVPSNINCCLLIAVC